MKKKVPKGKMVGRFKRILGWVYFSDASRTLDSWTGGRSYKLIWEVEILGIKLNMWKKL